MRDKDHFRRFWCVKCREEIPTKGRRKRAILWCDPCKTICKNCSAYLKQSSGRRNLCLACEYAGIKLYKLFPHVMELQKHPYKKN